MKEAKHIRLNVIRKAILLRKSALINKRIINASKVGGKSAVEKELELIRNELLFDKKVY